MRTALLSFLIAAGVASSAVAGPLSVPLNHSVRLKLSGSAASVVIGNPQIADVTVVDTRTLFVSGKGVGSTDVTVVDALGRTIYNSEVSVGAPRDGHLVVYRASDKGTERMDMSCNPRCERAVAPGEDANATSAARAASLAAMATPATSVAAITAPSSN